MIILKVISPKRIQPDVFRQEILNELRKVETAVLKDYRKTTATWNHKVQFDSKITFAKGSPGVIVETDDKIYGYVTYGTKAHPIVAHGNALVFTWGGKGSYKAKTTPRVIGSQAGGPSGKTVFFKSVQHPGTEAREFHETIHEKWIDLFAEHMQDALDRGAKKCGHGMNI